MICTYPLDLVRVRLAVTVKKSQYDGVLDCIRTIYRSEGILSLYRGIGPTLLVFYSSFAHLCQKGIVPYAGTNFAAYEALKGFSARTLGQDINQMAAPVKLLCGGLAGAIGQTGNAASSPF